MTVAADGLTAGLFYSFQFRSQNQVGYSELSAITRIGLGAEPPALGSLVSNLTACGPSFVAMTWDAISAPLQLPVLGYFVQMIDPVTDEWEDVLDASTDPDVLSHTQYGAMTGESYTFRVFAVNFNGRSTAVGNNVEVLTCGLPLHFAQPTYVTSSRTSISIEWAPPFDDGGC